MTGLLVLVRHAETEWTAAQRFTGWSDPPLSEIGQLQAHEAGTSLAGREVFVDRVYTSVLRRATQTVSVMLAAAGARAEVCGDWRLNERHLGGLEGLTKSEIRARWGNELRRQWRDDPFARPPSLAPDDPRHPRHDPRYRHVPAELVLGAERQRDIDARVLEFFHERVVPDILGGRTALLVTHLGPLRTITRHLDCTGAGGAPLLDWPHAASLTCAPVARPCCAATVDPLDG